MSFHLILSLLPLTSEKPKLLLVHSTPISLIRILPTGSRIVDEDFYKEITKKENNENNKAILNRKKYNILTEYPSLIGVVSRPVLQSPFRHLMHLIVQAFHHFLYNFSLTVPKHRSLRLGCRFAPFVTFAFQL